MIAMTNKGLRVEATRELKLQGEAYCRQCCAPVVFKRGRVVTAHFAHKTATSCTANESRAHLEAKAAILRAFRQMGYKAEPEYIVNVGRRIDVAVWGGNQKRLAFEVQASPISEVAMQSRQYDHARAGFITKWIFTSSRCPGLLSADPYVLSRSPGEVRVPHEMHHLGLFRGLEVIDRNGDIWDVALIPVIRPGYCFTDSYGQEQYAEETTLKSTFYVDRYLVEWSEYAEVLGQQLTLIGSE